jgi:hypothetical protein
LNGGGQDKRITAWEQDEAGQVLHRLFSIGDLGKSASMVVKTLRKSAKTGKLYRIDIDKHGVRS